LIVTLFSVISANLYPSDLKRQFFRVAKPYIYVTGLDQGWDVFAPDPRKQTVAMQAQIVYSDGSVSIWKIPSGEPLFGAYWDYRWRKWVELMIGGFASDQWKTAAQWVAHHHADPNRRAVEVQLVSRWQNLTSPGTKPSHSAWFSNIFYTLKLKQSRAP
jgi:hypothetical protein